MSSKEQDFIKKEKGEIITINQYNRYVFIVKPKENSNLDIYNENCRLIGDKLIEKLTNIKSVVIIDTEMNSDDVLQVAEGMALSNYTFNKYKGTEEKLEKIFLITDISSKKIDELNNIIDGVHFTRDLINEPFSHLKAVDLALAAKKTATINGFKSKTLYKKRN